MWKFRSMTMSGWFLVMRCGGPIAWKSVRQDRCSRSSCEAEIRATDEGIKEVLSLRARCADMSLSDTSSPTPVYTMTIKVVLIGPRLPVRKVFVISISEIVLSAILSRLKQLINPAADITKEMKEAFISVPFGIPL